MRVRVYEPVPRPGVGPGAVPVEVATAPAAHRSFEVRPMGAGRHRLELAGAFEWRWADPLCRGLARARIAVRRGFAVALADGSWRAAFQLEAGERKRAWPSKTASKLGKNVPHSPHRSFSITGASLVRPETQRGSSFHRSSPTITNVGERLCHN